jgi:hypothetical protein
LPDYLLKAPEAKRLISWDWSRWLTTAVGTSINSVESVYITPEDGSLEVDGTPTFDETTVSAWLIGGEEGVTYQVSCRIVSNAPVSPPEKDERTMTIMVQRR